MRLSCECYSRSDLETLGLTVRSDGENWVTSEPNVVQRERLTSLLKAQSADWDPFSEADELLPELKLPVLNHFRRTRMEDGRWLVSVETGQWVVLNDPQMRRLEEMVDHDPIFAILEKNYIWLTSRNIDSYKRLLAIRHMFLKEGPTLHIMAITSKCNLACSYCQASASDVRGGQNMTTDTAMMVLDRIFESPGRSVVIEFQGGEPLINFPVIKAIVEEATRRSRRENFKVEFCLISNFTSVLTKERIRYLIENKVDVCLSLDGPEDIQDMNRGRGYPDLFNHVVGNITMFRDTWRQLRGGEPELNALLTVTRTSIGRLDEIISTYLELGFTRISLRPLSFVGMAKKNADDIHYSAEEYLEFWQLGVDKVLQYQSEGRNITETFLELILIKLFSHETGYMDWRSPCGAGIGQIAYNVDGQVYTCDEGRMVGNDNFKIGRVESDLNFLLTSDVCISTLNSSMTEQLFCDYCAYRPFCGICPVLNYSEHGHDYLGAVGGAICRARMGMIAYVLHLYEKSEHYRNLLGRIYENAMLDRATQRQNTK